MYSDLVDLAYTYTGIIMRKYKSLNTALLPLISGVGSLRVGLYNEVNYQAILDAIHLYYSECNVNVKFVYKSSLERLASMPNLASLNLTCNYILYGIDLDKSGRAKFKQNNFDKCIDLLSENIRFNYFKYRSENDGFDYWLSRRNCLFKKEFGVELYNFTK